MADRKRVAELEGAELDWWVARALGCEILLSVDGVRMAYLNGEFLGGFATGTADGLRLPPTSFVPSSWWKHGGPIIERERGTFSVDPDSLAPRYFADMGIGTNRYRMGGPTHLIAAMRAFVASKFGETVEAQP